jgi:hypothetical protein
MHLTLVKHAAGPSVSSNSDSIWEDGVVGQTSVNKKKKK